MNFWAVGENGGKTWFSYRSISPGHIWLYHEEDRDFLVFTFKKKDLYTHLSAQQDFFHYYFLIY